MACRGVLFSIDKETVDKLQALEGDAARVEYIQEVIEVDYFDRHREWLAETDKAWDCMHRAISGCVQQPRGDSSFSQWINELSPLISRSSRMALHDPVAVFDADTNVEAQLVRTLLVDAGIEAFAIDDVSYVGTCAWGTLSGINKPQVFVERGDAERALDFLDRYEDRIRERQTVPADNQFCHHCGEPVEPGAEACAACGQSLDSSDDAEEDRSDDHTGSVPAEQDGANGVVPHGVPSESLATFRSLKKPLAWMFVICLAGSLLFQVIAAVVEVVGRVMGSSR